MIERDFQDFALRLAPVAAAVANFCDHVEHNEPADRDWVIRAGEVLRIASCELACTAGVAVFDLYAERLGEIEARNVLGRPGAFDGHRAVLDARTWRELQVAQSEHDRHYHPDVAGLAKAEQLRHYALHVTKIVGAFAQPRDVDELLAHRLPDTLLFGIKLPTVMGVRLGDGPLQAAAGSASATRSLSPHFGG